MFPEGGSSARIWFSKRSKLTEFFSQLRRFLVSGALAAGVDIGIYILLLDSLGVFYAKAVSFTAATITTYVLNKYWTFEKVEHSNKTILLYITFYSVSIYLNSLINGTVAIQSGDTVFAFLVATAFSTAFNFFGLKYLVFR